MRKAKTPVEFDSKFSIKILGYEKLEDFYSKCSCFEQFKNLDIPTFLILAKNDPTFE